MKYEQMLASRKKASSGLDRGATRAQNTRRGGSSLGYREQWGRGRARSALEKGRSSLTGGGEGKALLLEAKNGISNEIRTRRGKKSGSHP